MFGFTSSPCRSCSSEELSSLYQSIFCGLSCNLSKHYSPAARFLVNRDSSFLSLVGMSLENAAPTSQVRTCCNPFGSIRPVFQEGYLSEYVSAVTVCGLATKLEDDSEDEAGMRKLLSSSLGAGISPMRDKAVSFLNSMSFPTAEIQDRISQQKEIEASFPSPENAASATAFSYGNIFSHLGSLTGSPREGLFNIGHLLGELIYFRDAFDDQEKDQKEGAFNLLSYLSLEELQESARKSAKQFQESIRSLKPLRYSDSIQSITDSTIEKHRGFLGFSAEAKDKKTKKQRKRGDRWYDNWCSDCCCYMDCGSPACSKSSGDSRCCDSMCDCGPGDSGCCDCGCCCPYGN